MKRYSLNSLGLAALLFAISSTSAAGPLSVRDFQAYVVGLRAKLASNSLTAASCKSTFDAENKFLYESLFQRIPDLSGFTRAGSLRADPISKLFELRLTARERFQGMVMRREFASVDAMEACAYSIKIFSRLVRGWEDVWGLQYLYQNGDLERQRPELSDRQRAGNTVLKANWPATLWNPNVATTGTNFRFPDDLRSGDVLLSRGNTFTSAVISRIGAIDSQFSHIAIVYKADGSVQGKDFLGNEIEQGKHYVIEAELNGGLRIVPISFYVSDGKTRAVLFRYRQLDTNCSQTSEAIAKFAGELMAKRATGPHVDYNFSMAIPTDNPGGEPELFCSQVVSTAYERAFRDLGCGQAVAPQYRRSSRLSVPIVYTPFDPQSNVLLRTLGIMVNETFAPADIEIDPRFELIGEWRNFVSLPQARHYDVTLTQIFEWMEKAKYQFASTAALHAVAQFGQFAASEANQMPANTPAGYVEGTMLMYVLMELNGAEFNLPLMLLEGQLESRLGEFAGFLRARGVEQADISHYSSILRGELEKLRDRRGLSYLTGRAEALNFTQAPPGEREPRRTFFTERQLEIGLEMQRAQDCQRFIRRETPLFHDFFRADFSPGAAEPCPQTVQRWWERRSFN